MTEIVVAALAVAVVAVGFVLGYRTVRPAPEGAPAPAPISEPDRLLREHLLDRYVVTLLSGESFSGLLAEVDDRTLILREAQVLSANGAKADGDVVLRRESIAYMQRPS